MSISPKVAISSEFFTSVLKLPKAQQDKAVKFMEQFRHDPKSPGINYETIQAARDKNLRSVRIDQAYRAIVLAPDKGNVFILLWADKHDDAYHWAQNKVLKINPENGVLQFLESEYIDEAERVKSNLIEASDGLFSGIRDRHLIVDEAQDFGFNAFKLIRHLVSEHSNDLFIVGDPHQRIYGSKVTLGHCDIRIVGRSHKLRVNYRTTEQIRHAAVAVLEGIPFDDLDDGLDEQKGYRSLMTGVEPVVQCFNNAQEELNYLIDSLAASSPEELTRTCIAVRRHIDIDRYSMAFGEAGIAYYKVDHNSLDDANHAGVRMATMHRVKGLEFDTMYVAGVNDGVLPLAILESDDPTIVREHEWRERSLLYVAITRAKRFCSISGFGTLSKFIQ
ncbi:3'-5' exonuclease [Methylomarinum vadi]|uniref:3'-5' exonuclease n=1 Tax=Methylomarinum vadi TaxID=438855 RepID=UPI0004DF5B01|nr:3'-5' exonuclease [Methylomarinum vadi]